MKKETLIKIFRYVVDFALIVALISAIYSTRQSTKELKNQITYLQDSIDIVQSDVTSMETNIEATLEEQSSHIETCSIRIEDWDFAHGNYVLKVNILPKEFNDTTQTSVFFGTKEYPLSFNGYGFEGLVVLPMGETYDGNVTILFEDGGRRITEVLRDYKDFQSGIREVLTARINSDPVYQVQNLSLKHDVVINLNGGEDYQFESLVYVITVDGQEVYKADVLGDANSFAELPEVTLPFEKPEDAVEETESSQNEAGENEEIVDPYIHEAFSNISGTYQMSYEGAVLPEQEVRVFLRATTTSKDAFEYDLFRGTTNVSGNGFKSTENNHKEYLALYDKEGGCWVME